MRKPSRLQVIAELVRTGHIDAFVSAAHELEAADLGEVLSSLDDTERLVAVSALPPELSGEALAEMPEEDHAEDTLAAMHPGRAAEIVGELADDDAADLLGQMDEHTAERILAEVEAPERADVEKLLRYDEESAGGLMTTRLVTVPDNVTAAEAIEAIRRQSEEAEGFIQVYVTDRDSHLQGIVPLKGLVTSPPERPVREFMEDADIRVHPEEGQEHVADLMSRYNLLEVPVVDGNGRLLGRVTFDDVIDVVEAEATEDLLKFGGVSADEDIAARWTAAVRSRLPWLYVNLITAFMAASVVGIFQNTIARLTVLALWMPVIAGMGGNAGTQALAVTVRRLALGLVPKGQGMRVVAKEVVVGLINGVGNGLVVMLVAMVFGLGIRFGVIVFLAMTCNLMVAGFAGAFVPILLEKFKVDPAVASSIFVTTFTDMIGFFLLLGLATKFLL
ncbi:MAG: magnesium transporter [Gemmatimonadales bacterium]